MVTAGVLLGHWLDSLGNSIIVSESPTEPGALTAVLTPLIDHPEARDRVVPLRRAPANSWRCGNAPLEWFGEDLHRLVWSTGDGRRSVWTKTAASDALESDDGGIAFPWLLSSTSPEPWLPLELPRDILYDGARVAALLDIRQMIGSRAEPQERLTRILMDHDLTSMSGDYLVPGADAPPWQTLQVTDALRRSIAQRIHRIPHEALCQQVRWSGESEVTVGHHKIPCRARDIQALDSRWVLSPKDERKPLEIARLLALYSVFDNPLSNRRNGVHLGLDPELRLQSDYELFASPLNAAVPNGRFASKWPHVEWRFGSIGSYPSVLNFLPANAIVCVNPPFTEAYLADVMARLDELKGRFRLRIAMPIQEMPWRRQLHSSLPSAEFLSTYYDASAENHTDVLHPTLLWEDPRCPEWHSSGADVGYQFSEQCGAPAAPAAPEPDASPAPGAAAEAPASAPSPRQPSQRELTLAACRKVDAMTFPLVPQANKVGSAIEEAALDESEWPSLSKSKEPRKSKMRR